MKSLLQQNPLLNETDLEDSDDPVQKRIPTNSLTSDLQILSKSDDTIQMPQEIYNDPHLLKEIQNSNINSLTLSTNALQLSPNNPSDDTDNQPSMTLPFSPRKNYFKTFSSRKILSYQLTTFSTLKN